MDLNQEVVFIPVTDLDLYGDYEDRMGYGSMDQVFLTEGIVVSKDREDEFKKHVQEYEEWRVKYDF